MTQPVPGQSSASNLPDVEMGRGDQSSGSIVLDTDGGTFAVTPDATSEDWSVHQWMGQSLGWVRENRPQVTTAVKTAAAFCVFAGCAIEEGRKGDKSKAAEYVKAAGDIGMALAATSDVFHYLYSAGTNFMQDPKESLYDLSKAAAQAVATGVSIAKTLVPMFRGSHKAIWGMANAIATATSLYATGQTATEKIAERVRQNVGRSHQDVSLVNLPATVFLPGTQEPGAPAHATGSSSGARPSPPSSSTSRVGQRQSSARGPR